jgi:hypothetical protein
MQNQLLTTVDKALLESFSGKRDIPIMGYRILYLRGSEEGFYHKPMYIVSGYKFRPSWELGPRLEGSAGNLVDVSFGLPPKRFAGLFLNGSAVIFPE